MAKESAQTQLTEELFFKSDNAFLCMIINKRTKFARVIDFRAGALPSKRLYIQSMAKKSDIVKVITLVEKDEVTSWTRIGFTREGTIPGFYKRSDGHLCGCVISNSAASEQLIDEDIKLAEHTVNQCKKAMLEIPETLRSVTYKTCTEAKALKARDNFCKKHQALNTFDSFGRGAARAYAEVASKKSKTNYLSAEYQDCFGHSMIEVLRRPESIDDIKAMTHGLRMISEQMKERGIIAAFSFAPSDDVASGTAFMAAGYRKTGLLAQTMHVDGVHKDAILWTKKLANPAGDNQIDDD